MVLFDLPDIGLTGSINHHHHTHTHHNHHATNFSIPGVAVSGSAPSVNIKVGGKQLKINK